MGDKGSKYEILIFILDYMRNEKKKILYSSEEFSPIIMYFFFC
jgi:hypothetical protein